MTDKLDTAAIRTGYATLLDALISEDLDDAARTIVTLCDALDAERADNERLRAAMRDVISCDHHSFYDGGPPKYVRIARAALGQEGDT